MPIWGKPRQHAAVRRPTENPVEQLDRESTRGLRGSPIQPGPTLLAPPNPPPYEQQPSAAELLLAGLKQWVHGTLPFLAIAAVAAVLLFLYLDRAGTDPSEPGVAGSAGAGTWASYLDSLPEGAVRQTARGVLVKRGGRWQPYQ
jgi:hypothetical protein